LRISNVQLIKPRLLVYVDSKKPSTTSDCSGGLPIYLTNLRKQGPDIFKIYIVEKLIRFMDTNVVAVEEGALRRELDALFVQVLSPGMP